MGGCASKPKDMGNRKLPSPAIRKPHAPPEVPVEPPEAETVAQEKRDGDENKETTTEVKPVDVCEPAPKMEQETTEVKPVGDESVPVEVKPTEEKKEVAETVEPNKEEKEVAETVEVKEVAGTEAAKEKKEEAETHAVPTEKKGEEKEA